jgi:tricorn protease interacting factor F2/3
VAWERIRPGQPARADPHSRATRFYRARCPPRVPTREYQLDLDVNFRNLTFRGHVAFLPEPGDAELVLDAVDLTIESVTSHGTDVPFELGPERQELRIHRRPAENGPVEIGFAGKAITQGLVGLYRTQYGSEYALTTQFAATEARRLFPCWDRPDRKAVFRVSVTVDRDIEVIFNTPVEDVRASAERKTIRFAPTPRMSTYLLYLGVGHFDSIRRRVGGVDLAVFAPMGLASKGEWALDLAGAVLAEYARYYGIPYPLPKLDLIAVPDFWAGAMENWGAITFSESNLFVDQTTSTLLRRTVAETVAHEIAHMWFGNLVTMSWWSDLWLNESFATFMSFRIVDRVRPELGIWSDFLPRWTAAAFQGDSLAHTHPIFVEVREPDQINQIFDEISYGKGASVLRMLERYLGEEVFRSGINAYLKRFQYANAQTDDLWRCLEEASGQPVRRMMDAWVRKPGVPVLYAHHANGGLVVEQKRFALSGHHLPDVWPVPVVARIDGTERRFLLDEARGEVSMASREPALLNVGANGFYRVLYDLATYDRWLEALGRLPAFDQWGIVHDLAPFVLSGDLSLELYLRFVVCGGRLESSLVVQQFARGLNTLYIALPDHSEFRAAYRGFLRSQTERLGLARQRGEPELDGLLREDLLVQRVWLDPGFAATLAERYPECDQSDPDARTAILVAFARVEGARARDLLRARLRAAETEAEILRLVQALTAFTDPKLVEETLALCEGSSLRLSLVPYVVLGATRNPNAREQTWQWFRKNLDAIAVRFRGSGWTSRLLENVIPRLGLDRKAEVTEFFRSRPVVEGDRGVEKGLELLEIFHALRARQVPEAGSLVERPAA